MNNSSNKINAIGIMSGTSLDGVDVVLCSFSKTGNWSFQILKKECFKYDAVWLERLNTAKNLKTTDFIQLHNEYGYFLGDLVSKFLEEMDNKIDIVCSHGHTIFHEPEKNISFQIGNGNYVTAKCKLPVIADFRTMDIALNGQGAPLVPIGDKLLFSEYDFCLNLGGFSNISFDENSERIAFDISPCNLILNYLSEQLGKSYDKNGDLANEGTINQQLLEQVNQLDYFQKAFPKSLGTEWLEKNFLPVLNEDNSNTKDKLATICEHIGIQIAKVINTRCKKGQKMLITGGGAHNTYLLSRIMQHCECNIVVPSSEIIDYKEAIIFAFLGVLRYREEFNSLKSVTGASQNSTGGAFYSFKN